MYDAFLCRLEKSTEDVKAFKNCYKIMNINRFINQAHTTEPLPAEASVESLLASLGAKPKALEFAVQACDRIAGRRSVFHSKNGHIRSGPPETAEGDEIFVLNGMQWPVILRQTDPLGTPSLNGRLKYRAIGPAFTRGLMDMESLTTNEHTQVTIEGVGFTLI